MHTVEIVCGPGTKLTWHSKTSIPAQPPCAPELEDQLSESRPVSSVTVPPTKIDVRVVEWAGPVVGLTKVTIGAWVSGGCGTENADSTLA